MVMVMVVVVVVVTNQVLSSMNITIFPNGTSISYYIPHA
jgi:hypothetical protein